MCPANVTHRAMLIRREEYSGDDDLYTERTTASVQNAPSAPALQRDPYEDLPRYLS